MPSATLSRARRLYLVGASARCAECGRVISQGRAAWAIDRYRAPICELCATALYGSDDASPIPCATCGGDRVAIARTCYHGGHCPCARAEIPCRDCDGTGYVLCSGCGERPAVTRVGGWPYCATCAAEEA